MTIYNYDLMNMKLSSRRPPFLRHCSRYCGEGQWRVRGVSLKRQNKKIIKQKLTAKVSVRLLFYLSVKYCQFPRGVRKIQFFFLKLSIIQRSSLFENKNLFFVSSWLSAPQKMVSKKRKTLSWTFICICSVVCLLTVICYSVEISANPVGKYLALIYSNFPL